MGNTTSSTNTGIWSSGHQLLLTVIDREQQGLHDRVTALGFADLAGYLKARCQQQTSLAQLASELATTTVVPAACSTTPA